MSPLTIFLAVVAIALFLVIVFVSFFFPKKQFALLKQKQQEAEPEWKSSEFFPGPFEGLPEEKMPTVEARFKALNSKVLMAHERIQRIEDLLQHSSKQKSKLLPAAQPQEIHTLNKRVERLMDFKSNAEIDIAAIKDALRAKGILKPLKKPLGAESKKKKASEKEFSESEKKLHDIIYRAASSK